MARIGIRHLEDLARQPAGKTQLGELVRRMVYATVAKQQPHLHFLAGETNGYAGWDGWVECSYEEHLEFRAHKSVWELSTDRNYEQKFKRDYGSACTKALPNGWRKADTIYVGLTMWSVTPIALAKIKAEIIKKNGNPWAGVVLLAADDVLQWLEKLPSVEDWATVEFRAGVGRFGKALEHWFSSWAKQTTPHVSTELLSCGRDLTPLVGAFKTESGPSAALQCDSQDEAVALVYCAMQTLPEDEARLLLANALVVTNEDFADSLADEEPPANGLQTVVLTPPATVHQNRLVQAGYRVIRALGRVDDAVGVLQFERASVRDFAAALASDHMSVSPADAEIQARSAGCSVSIWHIRNLFQRAAQPGLPAWAVSPSDAVIAAVFAGAWVDVSEKDVTLLASIAGMPGAQIESVLTPFALGPTPLLERVGVNRLIIAPTAAFEFIQRYITRHHVAKLADACREVFGQVDEEVASFWRHEVSAHRTRDRRQEISRGLRDGLAETLLRIAVLGDPLVANGALHGHSSAQDFVDGVVRALPGLSEDPRILASFNRQLPVLMEAAPDPFLDALDSLVQGAPDQVSIWLADESGIFGRSFHTGLLWGLEALAWSERYLHRVALLLAKLDRLDLRGHLANRPRRSLCEIFLPWHPGTSCPPAIRAEVLAAIAREEPESAWALLLELLPGKRQTSNLTHRPKWRTLGQADRSSILRSEVVEAYELVIQLTLDVAGTSAKRLADLIEVYPQLSPDHRQRVEEALQAVSPSSEDQADVQTLWKRLLKLCRHHRAHQDAGWSMPIADIERLESLSDSFASDDPVARYRWLFDEQFPSLGVANQPHEVRTAELQRRRIDALGQIIQAEGWAGIHRLLSIVTYSYIVGAELSHDCFDEESLLCAMNVWQGSDPPQWMAFRSVSAGRVQHAGETWTEALLTFAARSSWSPHAIAMGFVDYPDSRGTFELVQRLAPAARHEYWTNRFAFIRSDDEDLAAYKLAVDAFIEHGRAADVIDQNAFDLPKLGSQTVLAVIDAFTSQPIDSSAAKRLSGIDHDVQRLFKWLRDQGDVSHEELAPREYALLPLLTSYGCEGEDLALHVLLRAQPQLFVDLICDLYKPASGDRESSGDSEDNMRAKAHAAFELLGSWKKPPGVQEKTINRDELREWVDAARQGLRNRDRLDVGDQSIGKVLFWLPPDEESKAFPPAALNELLEVWRSEHIEKGFELEVFNSRGVTTRGMFDGGSQERDLARQWQQRADAIATRWRRAKRLCQRIADMWNRDAAAEDLDARRGRMEQSR